MSSGSLIDLVELNQDYNFTVNLNRSQECSTASTDSPRHAGVLGLTGTEPLIKYSFNKAKLDSFNYDTSIGSSKQFSAIFSTELDPDNLTKGFFISGLLGDRVIEDFHLLLEFHNKTQFSPFSKRARTISQQKVIIYRLQSSHFLYYSFQPNRLPFDDSNKFFFLLTWLLSGQTLIKHRHKNMLLFGWITFRGCHLYLLVNFFEL